MTRQGRRILFFWAVALFVLLSITVLIFAFGFRYDFKNNRLLKTGSLVIKSNLEAQIFINDKLEGQTSFLKGTFSKKQLLPGSYSVKVQKDKFTSWQKKVKVEEGLVSDFSHIILFGREEAEHPMFNGKSPLAIDREGQKVIYTEKGSIIFYDLGGSEPVYESESLSLNLATLKVIWGLEGQEALVYDKDKAFYFNLIEKNSRRLESLKQYSLGEAILRNAQLYFLKPASRPGSTKDLVSLSLDNLKIQNISKDLLSFWISKNGIFIISPLPPGKNQFIKLDLNGQNEQVLGEIEGTLIKKVENRNGIYYALIGSNLYSFQDTEVALKASKVNGFAISPDNVILGWHNSHEFWIEWVRDTTSQPLKKAGQKELITKAINGAGNIRGLDWYKNGNYAFLELDGGLMVTEIDLRGGVNSDKVLNLNGPREQAWYDLNQNKIFKLTGSRGLASIDAP